MRLNGPDVIAGYWTDPAGAVAPDQDAVELKDPVLDFMEDDNNYGIFLFCRCRDVSWTLNVAFIAFLEGLKCHTSPRCQYLSIV